MNIRTAGPGDLPALSRLDRHIAPQELETSVRLGRVYAAEERGRLAGWLRWNLFWDNTPFMNLLFVLDGGPGARPGAGADGTLGGGDAAGGL